MPARGRRKSDRSLSPVSMIKHRFVFRGDTEKKVIVVNAPAHVAKADVAQRSSKPTLHVGTPRVLFPTQNVSLGQKSLKYLRIARIRIHQQNKKLETLNPDKLSYSCYVS